MGINSDQAGIAKKSIIVRSFLLFLGTVSAYLATFSLVYFPVLQTDFYWRHDYLTFAPDGQNIVGLMHAAIRDGRILKGYIWLIIDAVLKSSGSTIGVRFVGLIALAVFASVFYVILKTVRISTPHAFLISLLVCVLPSFQLLIISTTLHPYIYSALLSSLSILVLLKTILKEESGGKLYTIIWGGASVILLIISLNIFQPGAMMFFALGIVFFISGGHYDFSRKDSRIYIWKYLIVGFTAIVLYGGILLKLIASVMEIPIERGELLSVWRAPIKIAWFVTVPLKNALNLWNIYSTYIVAFVVVVISLSDILYEFFQKNKELKSFRNKYILIGFFVLLSYLPNLIISQNAFSYRALLSLNAILAILFCYGLINVIGFLKFSPKLLFDKKLLTTILLGLFALFASFLANDNVRKSALQHSSELKYVKSVIQNYGIPNLLKVKKVYVRSQGMHNETSLTNGEFKLLGRYLDTSGEGPVREVINKAITELGITHNVQIDYGIAESLSPKENEEYLLIDMTKFKIPWNS